MGAADRKTSFSKDALAQTRSQVKKKASSRASTGKLSLNAKDFGHFKDLCKNLHLYSLYHRKESSLRALQAVNKLRELMEKAEDEDLMNHFHAEALAAVMNQGVRTALLKGRYLNVANSNKDISSLIQQHRDEFMHQISQRSLNTKREMKSLFQHGLTNAHSAFIISGIIHRLGEQISHVTLELCYSSERLYSVNFVNDGCAWDLLEQDDLVGLLSRKMNLCRPLDSKVVQLSGPRSDFILRPKRPDLDAWGCVYAVRGCMRALLSSVPLDLELLELAHAHAVKMMEAPNVSGLQLLALILDELHEGSQMLSEVITYPMQAFPLLKKKLWALGYHHEEGEGQFVLNVLEQMKLKWMETCRCMFEFSLPPLVGWRVGLHFGKACIKDVGYPGEDPFSFGIGHDHHVYYNGTATFYEHYDQRIPYNGIGLRTFAILIDFYKGSLHLGCGKTLLPPAFGYGASHFSSDVQNTQAQMIKTRLLIPMFALEGKSMERTKDQIEMRVNFGLYPFQCTIPSQSINALLALKDPTTFETKSVFEPPKLDAKDKEEEEKLYLAFEKTQFRTAMVSEEDRSWSQFPPSVYRRSLAATKIQRAFRIFRGRKWRKQLWITQTNAVIKIQRAARKRLAILHQKQYLAAKIIQKNWRKSMYLQLRLMSIRYKKSLAVLHLSARKIQTAFRQQERFHHSTILSKYGKNQAELKRAVNIISNWWAPIALRLKNSRARDKICKAATDIQRVWRGYSLRRVLRPDLRQRLKTMGSNMLQHRKDLLRLQSAFIIQRTWREYRFRKVRAERIRTRKDAATRIQRAWKGYWIRSHIPIKFEYGEAVFLTAVCKCLRHAHFILKMYKPCGIVCPKREFTIPMYSES